MTLKSHAEPYLAGEPTSRSRLAANTSAALMPAMPRTAPTMADRTGTRARPRPGSRAIRTPWVRAGREPWRASRAASVGRAPIRGGERDAEHERADHERARREHHRVGVQPDVGVGPPGHAEREDRRQ